MATYPAQYGVHYVLCEVCGRSTSDKVRHTCHKCEALVRDLYEVSAGNLQRALRIAHRTSYAERQRIGKSLALDIIHNGPVGLWRWKFLREVGDLHLSQIRQQATERAELRAMLRDSYSDAEDDKLDEVVKEVMRHE